MSKFLSLEHKVKEKNLASTGNSSDHLGPFLNLLNEGRLPYLSNIVIRLKHTKRWRCH